MAKIKTEDMIEQAAIELLVSEYHYCRRDCYTKDPETLPDNSGRSDKKQVVLPDILREYLCAINPDIPADVVNQTAQELCRNTLGDPMTVNFENYQKIRNGIKVAYKKDGRQTHGLLRLVDFAHPENNSFIVVSQMWIKGEVHWRRPDLILFINGLPLVFIELKNSNINVKNAYDKNLTDYRRDIPYLFNHNQICVLSNGMERGLAALRRATSIFSNGLRFRMKKRTPTVRRSKKIASASSISSEGSASRIFSLTTLRILSYMTGGAPKSLLKTISSLV